MEVLYPRCAGLDVHKQTVVACVRVAGSGSVQAPVRTFPTRTAGLLELADWLSVHGCTHVAMESTGVYWKPVWHMLADDFELVLANASHIRNVPGRKSDVNDAMWIADLLAHGLLRGSFVPPPAVQELRDLTRTRKQLVRDVGQHAQRIEKVLEDANLKLTTVLTDVVGASGRRMLEALIAGETNPDVLAALASPRVKAAPAALAEALRGRVTPHHRFLLREHLLMIDHLRQRIAAFEAQIGAALEPFRVAAARLVTIPGVSHVAAHVIVAELGIDMARFPTVGHLISWAGLCPRMEESAGKRRSKEIAAPELAGPQHAPSRIERLTRVRMEAWQTGGMVRTPGGHHVGLDGRWPSHGSTPNGYWGAALNYIAGSGRRALASTPLPPR